MAEGEGAKKGATKERHTLGEDDFAFLEELGLPAISATKSTALDSVLQHLRTAKTNPRLKAVYLASKENRSQPGVLQGKETTIKFVHLPDVSKATLTQMAKPLREQGYQVIPYVKGYLVALRED